MSSIYEAWADLGNTIDAKKHRQSALEAIGKMQGQLGKREEAQALARELGTRNFADELPPPTPRMRTDAMQSAPALSGLSFAPGVEQQHEQELQDVQQKEKLANLTFGDVAMENEAWKYGDVPEMQNFMKMAQGREDQLRGAEVQRAQRQATQQLAQNLRDMGPEYALAATVLEKVPDMDLEAINKIFGTNFGVAAKDKIAEPLKASEAQKDRESEERIAAMRIQGRKDLALAPKPLERKSTTQSAKITSNLGFGLNKFKVLRDKVASGDADVFKRSGWLGEFMDPELRDAVLQLGELHGREQSGAAISKQEWKSFEKQILNPKNLLTKEGRKTALNNIDEFIGRYYAKGQAVSGNDDWYDEYQRAAALGIDKVATSDEIVPDNVRQQAEEALNDPDATDEVKRKARQILGR